MKGIEEYLSELGHKDKTIVRFCEDLGKKHDVKPQTVREWFYQVKNDPGLVNKAANMCTNQVYASRKGHLNKKEKTHLGCSKETEVLDWIILCQELGILVTPKLIKQKALELERGAHFRASDQWLKSFYRRHDLRLRSTTTKQKRTKLEEENAKAVCENFLAIVKGLIDKYNILPRDFINVDETPMYWEYLPRRIVFKKGEKVVPSWKTSYDHKRSTLMLACNSQGDMLNPTLILKRKTQYFLRCPNNLNLRIQVSDSGWTTAKTFKDWISLELVPYLQGRHGILLLDSYEAHKCLDVKEFVQKNHPNIHCVVIPGGFTDILQPLDMGINSLFKRYCKEESLAFTNNKVLKLNANRPENSPELSLQFVGGITLLFFLT